MTQEAIAHRLERLAAQIHALERKYGTSFAEFDKRFQAGEIPDHYSYEVEQDYEVEEWLR